MVSNKIMVLWYIMPFIWIVPTFPLKSHRTVNLNSNPVKPKHIWLTCSHSWGNVSQLASFCHWKMELQLQ